MASALAAFARSLGTNGNETQKSKDGDDGARFVDSEEEEDHEDPKLSNSLAGFAKQQQRQHQGRQSSQATLSLLRVAQQEDQEARLSSRDANHQTLTMVAAQLSKEDAEAANERSDKIQSALQVASEEVRAQAQAKQRQAIEQAVQQTIVEEQQYLDAKLAAKRKRGEEQQQRECDPHRHSSNNSNSHEDSTKTWAEVQDELLGRVQLDLMHRELSKDAILLELQKECSFTPAISTKAKKLSLGTFDERLRRDLANRRARQDQYKILAGAIAAAAARGKSGSGTSRDGGVRQPRLANRSKRAPGLPPPANFQERLRLDLEKRREREQDNNFDAKQQRDRIRPKQIQIKW